MQTEATTTARLLGARVVGHTTEFRVWAPAARSVKIRMEDGRTFDMQQGEGGLFSAIAPVRAGERYFLIPDSPTNERGLAVPDPVSRFLPEGVHGPTQIVDPDAFRWTDQNWRGISRDEYIIYELHVGTFTPEGTFEAIVSKFGHLKRLGISVIELMPVNAFPGRRNWGYDGVSSYAVQESYGGPEGLKRLVDAAHRVGLAIVLDVVYNHLGNEGNYLRLFGPYFTDKHQTPWGEALNFDQPGSEGVRRYFVENALYWIREYHFDGLRLDAVQTIKDDSARHIVSEIGDEVHQLAGELGRTVCVIAETDENESRYVRPRNEGGYGLDTMWSDDFHHSIHGLLTNENKGYYQDFGDIQQVAHALNQGFVFQGEYFRYWDGRRGTSSEGIPAPAHVICIQNHDQVGNRATGERLNHLIPRGAFKLASALLLLAPETPLLFMGEEYGETAPFQFFTDFGDPQLRKAVSEGRRKEFTDFEWKDFPDPQDPVTFERSRLHWNLATPDNDMLQWYRKLMEIRRRHIIGHHRNCLARVREKAIVMRVPQRSPFVMVVAELPGSVHFEDQACWNKILVNDEDDYRVSIYLRDLNACDPTGDID